MENIHETEQKRSKGAGTVLLVIFIIILVLAAAVYVLYRLSSGRDMHTDSYEPQGGFYSIQVDAVECDVTILPSDEDECKVEYRLPDGVNVAVGTDSGTLIITENDNRPWYKKVFDAWAERSYIYVYTPEDKYEKIDISTVSGEADVHGEYKFNSARIETVSGSAELKAEVKDRLEITSTSGQIQVKGANAQAIRLHCTSGRVSVQDISSEGEIRIDETSGSTSIVNVKCESLDIESVSGSINLKDTVAGDRMEIKSVSGSVELSDCDADDIYISTVSGSVHGTLLSEKEFITSTVSGSVHVPDGKSSTRCEIETTSGSINFSISDDE